MKTRLLTGHDILAAAAVLRDGGLLGIHKNITSPLPRQVGPEAKADLNIRVFPLHAEKSCQFVAAENGEITVV